MSPEEGRTIDQQQEASSTREVRLAQRFVQLADTLVTDYDIVELLDNLVHSCVDLLQAGQAGIVLLDPSGKLEVMASSSEATHFLEAFQLNAESGPCWEAVQTGHTVSIEDLSLPDSQQRWPAFAEVAQSVGYFSVHSVPMRLREEIIGGLNLFSYKGHVLSEEDQQVGQALADIATVGILQQRSIHRISLMAEQLQNALNTRVLIEQGKGLLSEYGQVDMQVAFDSMRRYARKNQMKMSLVAERLVQRHLDPGQLLPRG